MTALPPCPQCSSPYAYEDGALLVCPECGHEWSAAGDAGEAKVFRDAVGNELKDGDSVSVIKDLKVGGSAIKVGTKVKNIRLLSPDEQIGDHDIACKVPGFGPMHLKTSVVKKITAALLFMSFALMPLWAEARPVSYPGGWTVMMMNHKDHNSGHAHYTLDPKNSVGLRQDYFRDSSVSATTIQHNHLLKRWNAKGSQANIYIKSGVGVAYKDDTDPAAYSGVAMDWENRRYFTSYENRFFWSDGEESFAEHTARLGWAPYEGDFGDLHSWVMIEAKYDAGDADRFSLTPLIRLFQGADLVEFGYNLDDGVLLNYIRRF